MYYIFLPAIWAALAFAQQTPSGASAFYAAPSGFPTSVFSSYYSSPTAGEEPEPALFDPVLNITFPRNLTNPHTIPENVTSDPVFYPKVIANLTAAGQEAVIACVISQIESIIVSSDFSGNCSKCVAGLNVAKTAALLAPELVPSAMIDLCQIFKLHSNTTCEEDFAATTFGAIWTQILSLADLGSEDALYICNSFGGSTFCPQPKTLKLNTTGLFPKPKPVNATVPKPNGIRKKILHLSDIHLDPRYGAGSEANCSSSLCCRWNNSRADFWYHSNFLNFINTKNPDVSGQLHWLIQELQAAEDAKEPVWIVGHVLTGWDGTNPMPNPTDLFYQIINRYSPHVIRNIFFGHTHEDFTYLFYSNNGTNISAANALTTAWVGPSITPLTNLNSGYRLYEVDTGSWDIYESYTFIADVSSFPNLTTVGPTFEFEYNTREAYGPSVQWPDSAPLNATFWHLVSEQIETNTSLAQMFNTYQGKSSVESPNCTSVACAKAKACYMRSGSVALAQQNCVTGYGSVQSAFTAK